MAFYAHNGILKIIFHRRARAVNYLVEITIYWWSTKSPIPPS